MGRYYNGDINGKFTFAIQSSDAANRFGALGEQPPYLQYEFDESHIPIIEKEIDKIKNRINIENYAKYEKAGSQHKEESGITKERQKEYADYHLGKQILNCLKENGTCWFEAEL